MNDRTDIQALKYGIDGNPFTTPQPVGEIHRLAVYQDQVNGCMGYAYGLDRIFDRRAAVKRRAKGDLVLLRRQEIIQFLVEAKLGKVNLPGMVVSQKLMQHGVSP